MSTKAPALLTDERIGEIISGMTSRRVEDYVPWGLRDFARAIEAEVRTLAAAEQQEPRISAEDLASLKDMQDEYDSLLDRWKWASAGSQEVADLHATFKARERSLGKLVEGGLFKRLLAAAPLLKE